MEKPTLAFIVPSLREPEFSRALGEHPAILKFLLRSRHQASAVTTFEQAVLQAFGYAPVESTRLPAGICEWYGDRAASLQNPPTQIARVDPAYVKAEPDHASIHSAAALRLSSQHAQALLASLNDHFAEDGYRFSAIDPWRWYLEGIDGSNLDSVSISGVSDRNMVSFLENQPVQWRRLQTEIQMVLHQHEVNEEREQQGLQPINSVWCWGGHPLPERMSAPELELYADDLFTAGLAAASGSTKPLTQDAAPASFAKNTLVCLRTLEAALLSQAVEKPGASLGPEESFARPSPGSGQRQSEHDNTLEKLDQWLASGMRELFRGRLAGIDLYPCDGEVLQLKRIDLFRFWLRRR